MIIIGGIIALVMRYWGNDLHFDLYSFHQGCTGGRCEGVQGVYRCTFALTVFFLGMSLLSKCMPLIQRGGWGWKYLVLAVVFVLSFLIPNGTPARANANVLASAAHHSPRDYFFWFLISVTAACAKRTSAAAQAWNAGDVSPPGRCHRSDSRTAVL